jgi:transcription factor CRZ1
MDQQRDRSPSTGPQSHITQNHSPSSQHYSENPGLGFALDPLLTTNNQQFSNQNYPPEYSNSFLTSQQSQQYPQATLTETSFSPSRDLNRQTDYNRQFKQEEASQQNQASISPFGHQHQASFTEELLSTSTFTESDFSLYSNTSGQEEQFEQAFFLNDPSQDSPQSVNPADVMSGMSSPQVQHTPTPPHMLYDPHQSSSAHASPSFNQHQFQHSPGLQVDLQQSSSKHASPPFNQHQFQSPPGLKAEQQQSPSAHNSPSFNQNQFQHSPSHSRNTSLGPESAAFPQAQMAGEWSMMPPQFTNHRRSPSEYSDVSSAAPSPNLPQHDTFEPIDQNHSPLVHPQDSGLYQDVLGIGNFSLSDPQAQHGASPRRGLSPAHTPSMSPRLGPQQVPIITQSSFILNPGMSDNGFGQTGPGVYSSQNQGQFGRNNSVEAGPGQAQQMMPPEINVEFAPNSRQNSFEPPKPSLDQDALTPPSRSKFHA